MADYAGMYKILFHAMTKAIIIMQEAQKQTEEMYISGAEPIIKIFPPNGGNQNEVSDYQE